MLVTFGGGVSRAGFSLDPHERSRAARLRSEAAHDARARATDETVASAHMHAASVGVLRSDCRIESPGVGVRALCAPV